MTRFAASERTEYESFLKRRPGQYFVGRLDGQTKRLSVVAQTPVGQGQTEIKHVQMRVIRRRRLAAQLDRTREVLLRIGKALQRQRRRSQALEREAQSGAVLAFRLFAQRQRLIEVGNRLLVATQAEFRVADVGQHDCARALVRDQFQGGAIVFERGVLVGREVHTIDLVARDVRVEPFDFRTHLLQHADRLPGDGLNFRVR